MKFLVRPGHAGLLVYGRAVNQVSALRGSWCP